MNNAIVIPRKYEKCKNIILILNYVMFEIKFSGT